MFPESYSKFPLAIYFTYGIINFHVTLSVHLTKSFLLLTMTYNNLVNYTFVSRTETFIFLSLLNSSTLATSCEELTHWKRLWCWEGLGQEEKGTTEDEMAGWYHRLDGCESEWIPGVGDGQGGLACCDSWGHRESDMTERLIWSDLILSEYP